MHHKDHEKMQPAKLLCGIYELRIIRNPGKYSNWIIES